MSETRIKEGGWLMSETRITGKRLARRLVPAWTFSQCMRDNGLPDYPDPDADGQLRGPAHEQEGNPKFRAAQEKCRDLAPGSEHQKTDPASVEQMRKFSQCMRDNGLPDYPDPDAD